jgi:hypothetical protein
MMLSEAGAARLLLDAGLLSAADIGEGGLTIIRLGRRNCNIRVVRADGTGFLIKQARNDTTAHSVRNEVRFLQSDFDELRIYVPHIVHHDSRLRVIVTELIRPPAAGGAPRSWKEVAAAQVEELGRAIAITHGTRSGIQIEGSTPIPRGISLFRPGLDFFRDLTPANIRLISAIQHDRPLCDLLSSLEVSWQSSNLIHGDLKFDNVVFRDIEGAIVLVDWEFAGLGDPHWDLGSILADLLHAWLIDVVTHGIEANDHDNEKSEMALFDRISFLCNTFLRSYCANAGKKYDAQFADECLGFSAARLLQTAFEASQNRAEPDLYSVKAVQMAANLAVRRKELARHLWEADG